MKLHHLLILTLICLASLSNAQSPVAPPIEYGEEIAGTYGGSTTVLRSPNAIYAVKEYRGPRTNSVVLSKLGDKSWDLTLCSNTTTNGSASSCPIQVGYASQSDGILISDGSELKKIDAEGKMSWIKNLNNLQLIDASTTLQDGFYLLVKPLNGAYALMKVDKDGIQKWVLELRNFSAKDIQTTSDDGVVVVGESGILYYLSSGILGWSNTNEATKVTIADESKMYALNNKGITQYNIANGEKKWSLDIANITDLKVTKNKDVVLMTGNMLYRIKESGITEWSNSEWGGGKQVMIMEDGGILVTKSKTGTSSKIAKIGVNNQVIWTKEFNPFYGFLGSLSANTSPDNGIYLSGGYFKDNATVGYPSLLLKIAPYDTTCRYKPVVSSSQDTEFCNKGSKIIYGGLSKIAGNILEKLDANLLIQWQKDGTDISNAAKIDYTATSTGIYRLKITQGKCTAVSDAVSMKVVNETPPTVTSSSENICKGEVVTLTAKGCDGAVIWSNGNRGLSVSAIPTENTVYSATCLKQLSNLANCMSEVSNKINVKVSQPDGLVASIALPNATNIYEPDSVVLKATEGLNYSFQWQKDGANIGGATKSSYGVKQSGNYSVEVKREACKAVSNAVNITVNKLLSVEPNESWVKIRPNPVSSDLYIDLPSGESIKSISIFSVDGKEVFKKRVLDQDSVLKLDTLPRGKYIFRVITSKGIFSRNLILE